MGIPPLPARWYGPSSKMISVMSPNTGTLNFHSSLNPLTRVGTTPDLIFGKKFLGPVSLQ